MAHGWRSSRIQPIPLAFGAALVISVAALGTFWSCHVAKSSRLRAQSLTPGDTPSTQLMVLIGGDTAGWIVPCGCTANQSGGFLRRGSFVDQQKQHGPVIVADVGGAPAGTSLYDRIKFEAILKGEKGMGVAAHNLGGPELALGLDALKRWEQELGIPFVSANVRDLNGKAVTEPCRIVTAGGQRLALIGVVSQRQANGNCRIDEPHAAVLAVLEANRGRYDGAIVLAYLPEAELRDLAAALPEVHAVVGGPTGQSIAPTAVGPTLLASATNKGKFLVRLLVPAAEVRGPWSGDVVEMNAEFPEDPAQVAILADFRRELATRDVTAAESGQVPALAGDLPAEHRIAGSQACRSCHPREHQQWHESGHARAWDVLVAGQTQMDSSCQKCHTTGFGQPGGFVSAGRSVDRVGVGCESCHGPAQAHVREPQRHPAFVARDQCVRCHDQENSPLFEFAAYWKKIAHGDSAPSTDATDVPSPN